MLDRSEHFVPSLELDRPRLEVENELTRRSLHPYLGWFTVAGELELQRHRARKVGDNRERPYEVLLLGGSVAQMFGAHGVKKLESMLKQDSRFEEREIHFMRFGQGAFKQPQQAMALSHLLTLGLQPDAVINIDGYNEVALGARNVAFQVHPTFPAVPFWNDIAENWATDRQSMDIAVRLHSAQRKLRAVAGNALEWRFERSAVLGTWTRSRLRSLESVVRAPNDELTARIVSQSEASWFRGPDLASSSDHEILACWENASISMQGMCEIRGIYYLHALQPTLHDYGSKELTAEEKAFIPELSSPSLDTVPRLYAVMRQRGGALKAKGVNFVDLSMAFARIEGPVYIDSCHYNKKGNVILGRQLAEAFLAGMGK